MSKSGSGSTSNGTFTFSAYGTVPLLGDDLLQSYQIGASDSTDKSAGVIVTVLITSSIAQWLVAAPESVSASVGQQGDFTVLLDVACHGATRQIDPFRDLVLEVDGSEFRKVRVVHTAKKTRGAFSGQVEYTMHQVDPRHGGRSARLRADGFPDHPLTVVLE